MKIDRKPFDNDIVFLKKGTIKFRQGITILVGCNGYGKSTFLKQVETALKLDKIPHIKYDNEYEGGGNSRSLKGFLGNTNFVIKSMLSSEGENIILNIEEFAGKIGKFVIENQSAEELYVLIDALDSGLSIDKIDYLKRDLFDFIVKDCKRNGQNIRFIITANSYELANGENCFDVHNCKYIKFNNYEEYRNFILETSEFVIKRKGE